MCVCDKINCGYWWTDEGNEYPTCHCPDDLSPAPCEDDDPDPDPFNEDDPYVVTNPMAFY